MPALMENYDSCHKGHDRFYWESLKKSEPITVTSLKIFHLYGIRLAVVDFV